MIQFVILVHATNVYIHKFTQWVDASRDSETDFESMFFIFQSTEFTSLHFVYYDYFLQSSVILTFQGVLEPVLNYFQ